MIASREELRLSLLPGPVQVELTAMDEAAEAEVTLGLIPYAESDGAPGQPYCGWCGRSAPPGGLVDESLGGPPNFTCADEVSCHLTREQRLSTWMTHQFPYWRDLWQKYLAEKAEIEWMRARAWVAYHPEQFKAWGAPGLP